MGADKHGNKELVAVCAGFRESKLSFQGDILDLKQRGLSFAPKLATGDSGLGFWATLGEVFPETKRQKCWVHKTVNILDKMPKSIQAKAKSMRTDFKNNYGIDCLIPLKKNMNAYFDASGLARLDDKPWKKVDENTTCYMAKKITSWGKCGASLNIILVKSILKSGKVRLWSLATTKDYFDPRDAVRDYRLRWQIEERYKQIKDSWLNQGFKSTSFNLVTAHIIFSILVYSLIQIYLNVKSLNRLANRTIDALKADEAAGKNSVIICARKYYAALDPDEGYQHVAFLEGEALKRFRKWITQFRKSKYRISSDPQRKIFVFF